MAASSSLPVGGVERARVLIIDDSAVARAVIARMVVSSERFQLAGSVGSAIAALEFLARSSVDFIVLDIEMPGIDGLSALPDLLAAAPDARILVVSSSTSEGAVNTIKALALGAADTLVKPQAGAMAARFTDAVADRLLRLCDDRSRPSAQSLLPPRAARGPAPKRSFGSYDMVAIGASTGGIHALSQLLREIPTGFQPPILITQHLPTTFMPYFAAQLALLAHRHCEVGTDHLRIRPGQLIVAPGDAHMRCVPLGDGGAEIRLSRHRAVSRCMPSVDPFFESIASLYGTRALAIVLSGMGRDGADGAAKIVAAGGCVVVQDQASSVVWGMPGAAAGVASAAMRPTAIGRLIASRRQP